MTQGNSLCVHSDEYNALRTRKRNATGDSPPLLVALLCPVTSLRILIRHWMESQAWRGAYLFRCDSKLQVCIWWLISELLLTTPIDLGSALPTLERPRPLNATLNVRPTLGISTMSATQIAFISNSFQNLDYSWLFLVVTGFV